MRQEKSLEESISRRPPVEASCDPRTMPRVLSGEVGGGAEARTRTALAVSNRLLLLPNGHYLGHPEHVGSSAEFLFQLRMRHDRSTRP